LFIIERIGGVEGEKVGRWRTTLRADAHAREKRVELVIEGRSRAKLCLKNKQGGHREKNQRRRREKRGDEKGGAAGLSNSAKYETQSKKKRKRKKWV